MNIRDFIFFTINKSGFRKVLYSKKRGQVITILNLHRISEEENYFWQPLHPNNFEELVKYVTRSYNVIHFSDIVDLSRSKNEKPPLILSFDDGYFDFLHHAIPVLNKYQCKSNHNIVIDCVERNATIWTQHLNHIFNELRNREHVGTIEFEGVRFDCNGNKTKWEQTYIGVFYHLMHMKHSFRKDFIAFCYQTAFINPPNIKMMNWDDIRNCVRSGVEIGNHTYTHDSFASEITKEELNREVVESKKIIESQTGKPCTIFSFPNGQFNDNVLNTVLNAGYDFLLFADNKFQTKSAQKSSNGPDFISRINIINESIDEMMLRVEGFHNFQRKRLNSGTQLG